MSKYSKFFQSDSQSFVGISLRDALQGCPESSEMRPATNRICVDELTHVEAILHLGITNWRRGNFDQSEQLLVEALEVLTGQNNIHLISLCLIALALVKTSLEKDNDAIVAYKDAIKLSPKNYHLWNNLASLYLKKNQLEWALFAYKNAIKIRPEDVVAWNGLANIFNRNENTEEAVIANKKAIAFLPEIDFENQKQNKRNPVIKKFYILPWIRLAAQYVKMYQYQKAIDIYKKTLELDAENAEIWNELGALFTKIDTNNEALMAFSKAIDLNPEYGEAVLNLAYAYSRSDMPQKSIPLLTKSIKILPNQQDREFAFSLLEKVLHHLNKNASNNTIKPGIDRKLRVSQEDATWFYYKYEEQCPSFGFPYPTYELDHTIGNSSDGNLKSI